MKNFEKKTLGIIPARFASTRFPGKPLIEIHGKTMIERVYIQASKAFETVYVATDDSRIFDAVKNFGGKVVMTSHLHNSGTDRCAEALQIIDPQNAFQIVVNIQGDEPFIDPQQLTLLVDCFQNPETQIATLVKPINQISEVFNPNKPKVVLTNQMRAIYFSRSPIPYIRNAENNDWLKNHVFYSHIGIYAYRTDVLKAITNLPQSSLEIAESLEQNRWIQSNYNIMVAITSLESLSIDTPDDLKNALEKIR